MGMPGCVITPSLKFQTTGCSIGGEPGRPYSIGSTASADPCRILLTVALTTREDEAGKTVWGKASGLLCRQVTVGDTLQAALRAHPEFNPPNDTKRPMIMIAAGCGIAPFMGFLEEQAMGQRSGPAWLIFGNRKRGGDFFYGSKLEAWHRDGILDRLDTAFSRDPDGGGYVQDRMLARRAEVLDWLVDRNAVLYACGKANTVGEGVRSALLRIVSEQGNRSQDEASRQLQRWEAEGKLRFDVID
jgi:sulfite reductase (NADPH) flavoprotein alpha-component